MENEMTVKKQFKGVLWSHLYMALIAMVFSFGAFWWFIVQPVWKELLSSVFMLAYFCVMYTRGTKVARQDMRECATTKAYPLKGVVLGVALGAVTFALWLLYIMTWKLMTIDGSISGYSGIVYNFAFMLWTFCYSGFMCLYKGGMYWYMHIVIYVFPIVALGLGYFAGLKGFSFSEAMNKRMYEKE